jgi:hypothetical protein
MKKFSLALLAAATALAITPLASASSIPLGSNALGALFNSTSGSLTSNPAPTFTAVYTENVYTYGAGLLAFEYTVTDTGIDDIGDLATNYGGYANGALTLQDVSGDGVTGSYNPLTGTVDVYFDNDIGPAAGGYASDTSTFILYTDASYDGAGPIKFQDTNDASGTALVPTPEPSSLLLLGSGLFGLAFVVFRKAKSSGLVLRP